MREKMRVEEIVELNAFKSMWFAWNNELNHKEAEAIYERFQLEINYEIDKLFQSFHDKMNLELALAERNKRG